MPHHSTHPGFVKFGAMLIALLLVGACSGSGTRIAQERSTDSVDAYMAALAQFDGDETSIDEGLERFATTYADLTHPELAQRIDQVYAPDLFFNDTVHTFTDRATLKEYMQKTGSNLHTSQVEIHQVLRDGSDVFVRWTMYFEVGDGEDAIRSTSIGISHLRFDSNGQVVVHQDYWDSAGALYAHLPIVGAVLRAAQDRLGE